MSAVADATLAIACSQKAELPAALDLRSTALHGIRHYKYALSGTFLPSGLPNDARVLTPLLADLEDAARLDSIKGRGWEERLAEMRRLVPAEARITSKFAVRLDEAGPIPLDFQELDPSLSGCPRPGCSGKECSGEDAHITKAKDAVAHFTNGANGFHEESSGELPAVSLHGPNELTLALDTKQPNEGHPIRIPRLLIRSPTTSSAPTLAWRAHLTAALKSSPPRPTSEASTRFSWSCSSSRTSGAPRARVPSHAASDGFGSSSSCPPPSRRLLPIPATGWSSSPRSMSFPVSRRSLVPTTSVSRAIALPFLRSKLIPLLSYSCRGMALVDDGLLARLQAARDSSSHGNGGFSSH